MRCDRESRLARGAGDGDARRDVRRCRLGDEIKIGNHVAMKPDLALGEDEPPAGKRQRAAQQVEAAGHLRVAGRPRDMQVAAQFGVDAAAADENAIDRRNREVERRVEQGPSTTGRLGLSNFGEASLRRRRRIDVPRARNGSRDAAEAIGHGNVHGIDRNAAIQIGLLGKVAADGERKIGGGRHDAVGHDLGVLAGHTNRAGEPGPRIEPDLAAGGDRTAVGGHAAQAIDANRLTVGDDSSGNASELEAGLVVAEFAIRQSH